MPVMSAARLDDNTVRVFACSVITGREDHMDMPFTVEQWDRFCGPGLIQDRCPHLDAGQREFLVSGLTPEAWAKLFPPEKEEVA